MGHDLVLGSLSIYKNLFWEVRGQGLYGALRAQPSS